ncbi:uncharacterized protein SEPMUDRAFT_80090 [Sphaerulina musiva SO2202]|uniref:Uncharacterized protein n=1 Tax=Sphaerulina musiva (strain SO2202) TaxID=692275 RepID=M3B6K9_SPHMS|nr:uncharacterized protein SEPMUDRAFT_80090 [Sphaerulina musiva SO2202]EMF15412.1 hypothetical protein SEPMUDRAFT_80090 [Sphaerulina musiva SO2202]
MRAALRLLTNSPTIQGGAGLWKSSAPGVHVWRQPVRYDNYKSPHGPQYKIKPHVFGMDAGKGYYYASIAAGFGVAAGTFAIMFFDSVPKVKEDILKKVPFIASFYTTEIAPEDNPF